MSDTEHLIDPILRIARGDLPRRQQPPRRYTELEVRRNLTASRARLDEELNAVLVVRRAIVAELLRNKAEVLPDDRIALHADDLRQVIDQAGADLTSVLLEVILGIAFEEGDDEVAKNGLSA